MHGEFLLRLIDEADIYVTNHSPQMRDSWGLSYEHLQARNPRLIYASLTAYGEEGPERDREGFDLVAYWSRSGLMDLVHAPDGDPAAALPGMGDHPTAVSMYAGIVTALLRRAQTQAGSYVHTSLLANGIWFDGVATLLRAMRPHYLGMCLLLGCACLPTGGSLIIFTSGDPHSQPLHLF